MTLHFDVFVGTFTTLVAVINPLEALPIFLKLVEGRDEKTRRGVALKSCIYAVILMTFFLVFGSLVLRLFGVPLTMVRIVGGIVLMRIGFSLFLPSQSNTLLPQGSTGDPGAVAFVPLAMPIMFGPGAMAAVIGMSASARSELFTGALVSVLLAIIATMVVTWLTLRFSQQVMRCIGPQGIDAVTRIVGFFLAAMGMGMIFHGVMAAIAYDIHHPPGG